MSEGVTRRASVGSGLKKATRIDSVHAREILDSRGLPTIEVDVVLESGRRGRASVPSGASTGKHEAAELRDGDLARYAGKGVQDAIRNVQRYIAPLLAKKDVREQLAIDSALQELDGTRRKRVLGGNAILACSLAVARAAAAARGQALCRYLAGGQADLLPVPLFNVINGGLHADNNLDFQEFLIAPVAAASFREALRVGAEVYQALKTALQRRGLATGVGDEGGFAPNLRANLAAIELILEAIHRAGYTPGRDVVLALDVAASTFFEDGAYRMRRSDGRLHTTDALVELYEDWVRQFPIASIEDGVAERDMHGWKLLTKQLGARIQIVGDDVFVSDAAMIRRGVHAKICNAALIKVNQVGTLSEAIEAIGVARASGYAVIVSHRSGETNDDFVAELAVGTGAGQIKAGAPCRGERVAKYNQLIRIEEALGASARYAGIGALAPPRTAHLPPVAGPSCEAAPMRDELY